MTQMCTHWLRAARKAREVAILSGTYRSKPMTTLIHAEIPDKLAQQAFRMVERGWAVNVDSIIVESLRRYLESHQEASTEQFLQEDVEWGLKGNG